MQRWLSICVLVAACGGARGATDPDAAGPDASPSACPHVAPAVPTGAAGAVHVHGVDDGDRPTVGYAVVFQDGAGTQLAHTDASGDVQATIHAPATVTLISPDWRQLSTITGVEPGDQLCFGCAPATSPPKTVALHATAPSYPNARDYTFSDGSDREVGLSGQPDVTMPAGKGVPFDLVAIAADDQSRPLAWAAAASPATTSDAAIALAAWKPLATFTATTAHVPAPTGTWHAIVERAELSTATSASPRYPFLPGEASGAGTTATVTQPSTQFGGPSMAVRAEVLLDGQDQALEQILPAATSVHLDADADFLPWVSGARYDACTHTLTWSEHGGAPGDATTISIDWHDGATDWSYGWSVLVPAGTTSFTFPALPALPKPDVVEDPELPPTQVAGGSITTIDDAAITSYAQARTRPGAGALVLPYRRRRADFTTGP